MSARGMTARVARGSLWGLGGQVFTLGASLVATPFVIRGLGSEAYGLLTLVNLLIGYLAAADLGMGQASTRFGAEAHARGDETEEAAVVGTSLLVLALPLLLTAVVMVAMARPLATHWLRLPAHRHAETIFCLQVAAVGLVARSVAGVVNTPQLVRLRLDLSTAIQTGGAVAQIALVPVAIALGGGVGTAVLVIAGAAVATAVVTAAASWRLFPAIWPLRVRREQVGPLLRFGGASAVVTLAGLALMNAEKLLLVRFASVTALAYYSVAFTLARFLALLPGAMGQALLPAFAQLSTVPDRGPLRRLYGRALEGLLLWIVPAALLLCAGARPGLTLWAGEAYGRESLLPLYILTVGCVFDGLSYVPRILLSAVGRPDVIARTQMMNLLPYVALGVILIRPWGAVGAAAAWTARAVVEALLMFAAARGTLGASPARSPRLWRSYGEALAALSLPMLLAILLRPGALATSGIAFSSLVVYGALIWTRVLTAGERAGVIGRLGGRWSALASAALFTGDNGGGVSAERTGAYPRSSEG